MSFNPSGLILFVYCITTGFTRGHEKFDSFGAKWPEETSVENCDFAKDLKDQDSS